MATLLLIPPHPSPALIFFPGAGKEWKGKDTGWARVHPFVVSDATKLLRFVEAFALRRLRRQWFLRKEVTLRRLRREASGFCGRKGRFVVSEAKPKPVAFAEGSKRRFVVGRPEMNDSPAFAFGFRRAGGELIALFSRVVCLGLLLATRMQSNISGAVFRYTCSAR